MKTPYIEETVEKIPYIAFEGEMTRMERVNHRLWVLCICLLVALVGTNIAWAVYESQFETYTETTQEISQNADADNGSEIRLIGGDYYGEGNTNGENHN